MDDWRSSSTGNQTMSMKQIIIAIRKAELEAYRKGGRK